MVVRFVKEMFPSHSQQYQPVPPMVYCECHHVIAYWLVACTINFCFTVVKDFNISNQLEVVPVNTSEVCFQLEAIDDEIVEDEEFYTLVVNALNPNDIVDANTTVVILDNDGKQ